MIKTKVRPRWWCFFDHQRYLTVAAGVFLVMAALAQVTSAGTIVGSKHDLAYWRDVKTYHPWDDFNQVCVYCHAPHNANQAQGALWNRTASVATFALYQSPTLDNLPSQPGRGSQVCLSCHDGTLAMDAVVQRPLYGTQPQADNTHGKMTTAGTDAWENCGIFCHSGTDPDLGWGGFENHWFYDLNLSADHPVSIAYPNTPEFVTPPMGGEFANGVRLVDGRVECISCHDPHDPTVVPFLVTADNGSALCYTCHNK